MVTRIFYERLTCLQTFASFSSSSDYVQAWRKLGMENHHLNNKSCFFWNVLVAVLRVINQPLLSLPEGNGLLFLTSLAFFTVLLLLKLADNVTSFVQATGNEPVADYLCKDGAVAIFGSNHSGKKYFLQWLTGGHQLVCRQVWLMGQNFVGIHQKLIYKIF